MTTKDKFRTLLIILMTILIIMSCHRMRSGGVASSKICVYCSQEAKGENYIVHLVPEGKLKEVLGEVYVQMCVDCISGEKPIMARQAWKHLIHRKNFPKKIAVDKLFLLEKFKSGNQDVNVVKVKT